MAGRKMGAGAAATALGAFIAACGSSSSSSSSSTAAAAGSSTMTSTAAAASGTGDLAIVNYALTLEYLEDQFYAKVIKSGLFSGKILDVIKTFGAEEHQHTVALHKVAMSLGTPAAKPVGKFPLESAAAVTKLAATVENLGAAAYLGQAGNIKSKQILAAALAIHSVEARHAATLNSRAEAGHHPRRRVRQAGRHGHGPGRRQAVHRLGDDLVVERETRHMTHTDLASPELAGIEVQGVTRASFLLRGALTAGAVYGATAVGPWVSSALAAGGSGDVDILNFALTLEYLETNFYKVKGKAVGLSGEARSSSRPSSATRRRSTSTR